MKRWLIVGCGYVGTALGQWVQRHAPTSIVIGVRRTAPTTPLPFPCIAAASHDPAFTRLLPKAPFDVVVFCAAAKSHDPAAYVHTYVDGAQALVRAMEAHQKQPARWLFTSSTAVYPVDDGRVVDESFPVLEGPDVDPSVGKNADAAFRAVTMARAEQIFLRSGWPAVVLRLGGIYGPGRTSFLARVRRGEAALAEHASYTNRIHRDDCAGALAHLAGLARPEAIYNGVDDAPADRNEVIRWLSAELGVEVPSAGAEAADGAPHAGATGKRVSNARLRASGYRFLYPTYREGYGALLDCMLRPLR